VTELLIAFSFPFFCIFIFHVGVFSFAFLSIFWTLELCHEQTALFARLFFSLSAMARQKGELWMEGWEEGSKEGWENDGKSLLLSFFFFFFIRCRFVSCLITSISRLFFYPPPSLLVFTKTKTCFIFSCLCLVCLCILKGEGEEKEGKNGKKKNSRPYDRHHNIWFIG